jgi:ribonuclease J
LKSATKSASQSPLRIIPLGGVGEIGKNSTLFEYAGSFLLVDAGVKFPEADMLGIDLVIPNYSYLLERADELKAIVLTHGHEDHIGALPFLVRQLPSSRPIPLVGAALTLALVDVKLAEHGLRDRVTFYEIHPEELHQFGPFGVEFIHVNHSVPDAVALAIRTDLGVVVHTGDFKLDPTPIEEETADIQRFLELGNEGVLAVLCDTTRVDENGRTGSEKIVGDAFARIMEEATGRIIVTTFASNVTRLGQVMAAANAFGRRVAIAGRSMIRNVEVAKDLGYLPDAGVVMDMAEARYLGPHETVLLTTGSQGEPASALSRIAADDHRDIRIQPGDTVVFSASPIPGNETMIGRTINNLYRRGAKVITRRRGTENEDVHVSGHGSSEEIRDVLAYVRPRYCIPVHGEYRHLLTFRDLAKEMGIDEDRVIITDIGDVVEIRETGASKAGRVTSGAVLVDGLTLGVTESVLRDRHHLAEEGVLVITVAIDVETGRVVAGPDFLARGVFQQDDNIDEIYDEARRRILRAISRLHDPAERTVITAKVHQVVEAYIYHHTRRRPMILPIVTEV